MPQRRHLMFQFVLALVLASCLRPSFAQQAPIILRVADHLPPNHFLVVPLVRHWMDSVTRATGGAVKFEYFPSEQLGKAKDMLAIALFGTADITGVVPSYITDKLPLSVVAELPGSFASSCEGTLAFMPLVAEGGMLARHEYEPIGFRPLFSIVLPPYQLFSRPKIDSVRSLEGLKIQAAGGAKEIMIRKLKAVPVRMAAPELYQSLSRGTIDGGMLGTGSFISYNLVGPAKYITRGENFGSVVAMWGMSETRWKQLPESVRKAMLEAGAAASRNTCAVADAAVDSDYEKMRQGGVTAVTFSPADHQEIAALAKTVQAEWKEALDKRGKPGSEVLKAFTDELAARRGASPVR